MSDHHGNASGNKSEAVLCLLVSSDVKLYAQACYQSVKGERKEVLVCCL